MPSLYKLKSNQVSFHKRNINRTKLDSLKKKEKRKKNTKKKEIDIWQNDETKVLQQGDKLSFFIFLSHFICLDEIKIEY